MIQTYKENSRDEERIKFRVGYVQMLQDEVRLILESRKKVVKLLVSSQLLLVV